MEERMEAKIGTEIRTNEERMETKIEASNEKFEVLRGTLVSRMDAHQTRTKTTQEDIQAKTDAHQEGMEAKMDAWLGEMRAWRKETTACQAVTEACIGKLEVSQEKSETVEERQEVPKEEAALGSIWGPKSSRAADRQRNGPRAMVGPGRRWPLSCCSCTAQETRSSGTRAGQCCKSNPERTDVREETSGATGMQQRHKGPRPNRAIRSGKQTRPLGRP
jgi:hypothetical protein